MWPAAGPGAESPGGSGWAPAPGSNLHRLLQAELPGPPRRRLRLALPLREGLGDHNFTYRGNFAHQGVNKESRCAVHGDATNQFNAGREAECRIQLKVHGEFR